MRINGKALRRSEVLEINALIDKHWDSIETEIAKTKDYFIRSSWGPDAIELLNGGSDWVVCDREEINAVFWYDAPTTWVACRELFQVCSRFSSLEIITWHQVGHRKVNHEN